MLIDTDEDQRRFPLRWLADLGAGRFAQGVLELFSLFVRGTALVFSVVAIAMAVLCLGGAVSDRLDTLTHVLPVWFGMGIAAIVLGNRSSIVFERRAIVGCGVGAALICGTLMLPEFWAAVKFRPTVPVPNDLKIIQFNVWGSNGIPQKTIDWIINEDADVVIVEEAGGEKKPVLKGLRARYPYASCAKDNRCGTSIFSRYEMTAYGGKPTQGPHPSIAWATIVGPTGPFNVVGVHYSWPLPAGQQKEQAAQLIRTVAGFDRGSTIVGGDFNATPWSFALRRQDKALGLYRWTRALPSWPAGQFTQVLYAPAPLLPIDHLYAGADWRAVQIRRGPVLGSDHRPIVVTLRRLRN